MTALKKYERLEATGLWRASPQAQRRDVHISFGSASLVIKDHTDTALTHWSLAAVARQNPGQRPAVFHPGPDSGEELEIDDPTMIDAIETVRRAIDRHRPKVGRLRVAILLGSVIIISGLGLFWLPGAMTRHTVTMVPDSTRSTIGQRLLAKITDLTGTTCTSQLGAQALGRLALRVTQESDTDVHVMRDMARDWVDLPGGRVLLSRRAVEDHDLPDVAAGHILAAQTHREAQDPLKAFLDFAGARTTFKLLTTGEVAPGALETYAESLMASPDPAIPNDALLLAFTRAEVPSTPYAYSRDITGETVLPLIEADPYRGQTAPALLSDGDWVSLQDICLQ